jgi:hypothetical protein
VKEWDRPRALVAVAGLPAIEVLGASAVEGLVKVHGWALMCDVEESLADALRTRGAVRLVPTEQEGEYRAVWVEEADRPNRRTHEALWGDLFKPSDGALRIGDEIAGQIRWEDEERL